MRFVADEFCLGAPWNIVKAEEISMNRLHLDKIEIDELDHKAKEKRRNGCVVELQDHKVHNHGLVAHLRQHMVHRKFDEEIEQEQNPERLYSSFSDCSTDCRDCALCAWFDKFWKNFIDCGSRM